MLPKEIIENLSQQKLTDEEALEANQNFLGFYGLLLEIDKRINPHKYENNRS